jgi:hypothetical protein
MFVKGTMYNLGTLPRRHLHILEISWCVQYNPAHHQTFSSHQMTMIMNDPQPSFFLYVAFGGSPGSPLHIEHGG